MLAEIYEPFERVVACVGGQSGHVKKGMASPRIDIDEEKDKEQCKDRDGHAHQHRCKAGKYCVLPFILPHCSIDAYCNTDNNTEHCCESDQLNGSKDTGGHNAVDPLPAWALPPVPAGNDTCQPAPVPYKDIGLVIKVCIIEGGFNGLLGRARCAAFIIGPRVHKPACEEKGHGYSHKKHDDVSAQPFHNKLEHIPFLNFKGPAVVFRWPAAGQNT